MYKSILQFNENGIKSIEKIIKRFLSDETKMIGDFVMDLDNSIQELQGNVTKERLEIRDEFYLNDKKQIDTNDVERRNSTNTILTT